MEDRKSFTVEANKELSLKFSEQAEKRGHKKFGGPGVFISIDEKSISPFLISLAMFIIFYGSCWIYEKIKYWRLKRSLDKLTPEQFGALFGDIINQSRWDPEARKAVRELLDNVGKKSNPSKQ